MKTVYLGGPIIGQSYQRATDWREYARGKLKEWRIQGISPMRGKEELKQESVLGEYQGVITSQRGIVTRDRFDCTRVDCALINLREAEKISIGTMIEYGWLDAHRKPIITVMEKEGNVHEHAFIRELTGFRVETLDEGLLVAKMILS